MKKKILFIDRDGTLIKEPPTDYQVDSLEKLELYPAVIRNLYHISQNLDYLFVMVTNQDGLGTESFPEDTFWPAHNKMVQIFTEEGIHFDATHIDRSFPEDNAPTRKPGTAMLTDYMTDDYDMENSLVIGDRYSDMLLAKNLGAKGIWLGRSEAESGESNDLEALWDTVVLTPNSWDEITHYMMSRLGRRAHVVRSTKETDIEINLNLDGAGYTSNKTGLGFFDHMLDQLGKHSGVDLEVKVEGDLHIDEHHTIEDTAITLGQAFRQALGDKRGIERYGCFNLAMDEALAQVALDFSGRSWLVYEADFERERVGDFPVEMLSHFYKSFCDGAQCNINMHISGQNAHHMIEASFKGLARSIRQAISRKPGDNSLPTTKGML